MLESATVASPFVYEEPVEAKALADRTHELSLLADRAADARNSRIEGARRYGKTSLLRAVLAAAEEDGAVAIEVGFLGALGSSPGHRSALRACWIGWRCHVGYTSAPAVCA